MINESPFEADVSRIVPVNNSANVSIIVEDDGKMVDEDEDDLDDEDRPEVELAKILGQRISDWTNEQARPGDAGWLENHNRPMKPSDIMVLVRSRSGPFIPTLTQTLKKNNVAVAGADRLTLTDQLVVQDLMVLVEYLLQPADNLALEKKNKEECIKAI